MDQPNDASKPSAEALLAYVEGFLLGLARRLDDSGASWYKAAEAADDCRAIARTIGLVRIPMDRPQPQPSK